MNTNNSISGFSSQEQRKKIGSEDQGPRNSSIQHTAQSTFSSNTPVPKEMRKQIGSDSQQSQPLPFNPVPNMQFPQQQSIFTSQPPTNLYQQSMGGSNQGGPPPVNMYMNAQQQNQTPYGGETRKKVGGANIPKNKE